MLSATLGIAPVMSQVHYFGLADCSDDYKCASTGQILFRGFLKSVTIKDSNFLHSKIQVLSRFNVKLLLDGNTFSNILDEKAVQGGVFVQLHVDSHDTSIIIRNCVLENQFHWNPVDSASNIFESALLIRLFPQPGYNKTSNNVNIHIHNTTFRNNERGLTFQGLLENILITDCVFESNIAMHAGAGILLLVLTKTPIQITNCTFEDNASGSYRTNHVRPPGSYFR